MKLSAQRDNSILDDSAGTDPILRGDKVEELPIGDPPHVHQPLIQSIVDEMNGKGRCPSTGESGSRTARVMDQILDEFYGRKAS